MPPISRANSNCLVWSTAEICTFACVFLLPLMAVTVSSPFFRGNRVAYGPVHERARDDAYVDRGGHGRRFSGRGTQQDGLLRFGSVPLHLPAVEQQWLFFDVRDRCNRR